MVSLRESKELLRWLFENEKSDDDLSRPSMKMLSPKDDKKKYLNVRRPDSEEDKLRKMIVRILDGSDYSSTLDPYLQKISVMGATDSKIPSAKDTGTSHGDKVVAVEALIQYLVRAYLEQENYVGRLRNLKWGAPDSAPRYTDKTSDKEVPEKTNVF
jgi:hypothetical protein